MLRYACSPCAEHFFPKQKKEFSEHLENSILLRRNEVGRSISAKLAHSQLTLKILEFLPEGVRGNPAFYIMDHSLSSANVTVEVETHAASVRLKS
jgi:hypothetical protein